MTVLTLLLLAAQQPAGPMGPPAPPPGVDPVVWPYWVAIAAMSTFIAGLCTAYVKLVSSSKAELAQAHADHRKADEEKSKRIAEDFNKDKAALLDVSVRTATVLEQVASEMGRVADGLKEIPKG